ncbi:MAG TPA: hypothetical protein VF456_20430 [Vicinamibacterales bacterium]
MSITTFEPSKNYAQFASLVFPKVTATAKTVSSGTSTTPTWTAADILSGLIVVNTDDAGTATFPTADLLAAAINGVTVGTSFDLWIRNTGDSTLTVAAGTGGTLATGNTNTVLTVATRLFKFVITAVKVTADPSTSNTYTVYTGPASAH